MTQRIGMSAEQQLIAVGSEILRIIFPISVIDAKTAVFLQVAVLGWNQQCCIGNGVEGACFLQLHFADGDIDFFAVMRKVQGTPFGNDDVAVLVLPPVFALQG